MPARTLLVAAAGAATGAIATALFLNSRAPTITPSAYYPPPPTARPLGTITGPTPGVVGKPEVFSTLVDPAGIFQYGMNHMKSVFSVNRTFC